VRERRWRPSLSIHDGGLLYTSGGRGVAGPDSTIPLVFFILFLSRLGVSFLATFICRSRSRRIFLAVLIFIARGAVEAAPTWTGWIGLN
jgi:hypothetical protein